VLVEAVTFDFWNTLMWEEPGSLKEKRLEVWAELLREDHALVDPALLERAHDAAHEEYVKSWTAGRQFRIEEAVKHIAAHLDGETGGEHDARVLNKGFREAGLRAAIHPSDGVRDCLQELRRTGVRVGIICDVGLTPSSVVRELLERHDLLTFFDAMSFSDEVDSYKPDSAIFEHALAELGGVAPGAAAHVGDRRRTDIGGAIAMGMISVRYNGVYEDETVCRPEAEIVVDNLVDLPERLGLVKV
jgi:putative hydrolase of the HAD superfamily